MNKIFDSHMTHLISRVLLKEKERKRASGKKKGRRGREKEIKGGEKHNPVLHAERLRSATLQAAESEVS